MRCHARIMVGAAAAALALVAGSLVPAHGGEGAPEESLPFEVVDDLATPGIETELSGIYPHLTDPDLYYVVTNGRPPYKPTMQPMLPVEHRNKLLTVNRKGEIVDAVALPDGGGLFGDIAFGGGYLWLGPLDPPEIWKVDPKTGQVVAEYPLPGPAGGLDYDRERDVVLVHNYIGHPHVAVMDAASGAVVDTLWSDENCQGMALVGGDWLTVWSSSWDEDAYTELWQLDKETGRPRSRIRMEGIHAGMAPLDPEVAGFEGFMTLVHVASGVTGETVIRRFRYTDEATRAAAARPAAEAAAVAAKPEPER